MKIAFFLLAVLFSTATLADDFFTKPSTITVFGGKSVSNSISDQKSNAWGLEQETPTRLGGAALFGYLNEGHKLNQYGGDKRDGVYLQAKFPYQLTHSVQTFFAAGPYYTATTITDPDGVHYRDSYCLSFLATAGVKVNLTEKWSTQARWAHVIFAPNNKDADVFLIGVGYTPNW